MTVRVRQVMQRAQRQDTYLVGQHHIWQHQDQTSIHIKHLAISYIIMTKRQVGESHLLLVQLQLALPHKSWGWLPRTPPLSLSLPLLSLRIVIVTILQHLATFLVVLGGTFSLSLNLPLLSLTGVTITILQRTVATFVAVLQRLHPHAGSLEMNHPTCL